MEKYEINHNKKTITIKNNVFENADEKLMKKIHNYQEVGYQIKIVESSRRKPGITLEEIKNAMAADKDALKKLEEHKNFFQKVKFYKEWKNNKK